MAVSVLVDTGLGKFGGLPSSDRGGAPSGSSWRGLGDMDDGDEERPSLRGDGHAAATRRRKRRGRPGPRRVLGAADQQARQQDADDGRGR